MIVGMGLSQQLGLRIVPVPGQEWRNGSKGLIENSTSGRTVELFSPQRRKSRAGGCRCYAELTGLADNLHGLVMGVGVGLPCTVMECGDVIYRSTLPQQGFQVTPPGVLLAILVSAYLWAKPGVAPGFWDMFVLAKLEQYIRPSYRKEDFSLGKKLGEGAFGTVYRASFVDKPGKTPALVVKKANEYGAVEVWMNERVRRACASSCADFVHGFREVSGKGKGEEFWLVWRYEGDATLADLISSKDFPYNVEELLFENMDELPRGAQRENKTIREIMRQIMLALQRLHGTGIVHRDIKPQNIIFSKESRKFKVIDLGAAADLRVGINYIPKEFLLDPRYGTQNEWMNKLFSWMDPKFIESTNKPIAYAAPEQYIMSTQTPSAPSPPVATALSPVLWQMNLPDRFDVYSTGLIFLQMAFPTLRSDSALITFNRQLKRCGYDLAAWREAVEPRASTDLRRGFEILDLDGGVGWELLQAMVRFKGRQRVSAQQALAHPYFLRAGLMGITFMQRLQLQLFRAAQQDGSESAQWVQSLMAKSGTQSVGGFTEVQLQKLREVAPKEKATLQRNAIASALKLQRKLVRTLDETVDEIKTGKKDFWWNRWQTK